MSIGVLTLSNRPVSDTQSSLSIAVGGWPAGGEGAAMRSSGSAVGAVAERAGGAVGTVPGVSVPRCDGGGGRVTEIARDERGLMRVRTVLEAAQSLGMIRCSEHLVIQVQRGSRDGATWYQLVQLRRADTGWQYQDRAVYLPASAVEGLVRLLSARGAGKNGDGLA